jgi:hypothetical protein
MASDLDPPVVQPTLDSHLLISAGAQTDAEKHEAEPQIAATPVKCEPANISYITSWRLASCSQPAGIGQILDSLCGSMSRYIIRDRWDCGFFFLVAGKDWSR